MIGMGVVGRPGTDPGGGGGGVPVSAPEGKDRLTY